MSKENYERLMSGRVWLKVCDRCKKKNADGWIIVDGEPVDVAYCRDCFMIMDGKRGVTLGWQ